MSSNYPTLPGLNATEKSALLGQSASNNQPQPVQKNISSSRLSQNEVLVSPVDSSQLPPAYAPSPSAVVCKVCSEPIDLSRGRDRQHVVKCARCGEATPLRVPPPGKKYVRCPCNCLLVCKSTSRKIACPREHCRRIITLTSSSSALLSHEAVSCASSTVSTSAAAVAAGGGGGPGTRSGGGGGAGSGSLLMVGNVQFRDQGSVQLRCGACQRTFLYTISRQLVARCPHCLNRCSIGPSYKYRRTALFIGLSVLLLAGAALLTILTAARPLPLVVPLAVLLVALGLLAAALALRYGLRMSVCRIVQPASTTSKIGAT